MLEVIPELEAIATALKSLKSKNIIRTKNLVGDLGEYYCKEFFGLNIESNYVNKGFDATDIENLKIEIKTRRTPEGKSKVIFRGFDFDYCLFVELGEDFRPVTILKISSLELQSNLDKRGDRLSVNRLKATSHQVVYNSLKSIL